MSTYEELMSQARALMEQAEETRKSEIASVVADIKAKMKQYGLSVADLRGSNGGGRKIAKPKSSKEAKYRGPNGELWAGGPGRKPEWVREIAAKGEDIEKYRI